MKCCNRTFRTTVNSPFLIYSFFTAGKRKEVIRVVRNTLAMSGLGILTSWCPMAFAILLAELRNTKFKKPVQTNMAYYYSGAVTDLFHSPTVIHCKLNE